MAATIAGPGPLATPGPTSAAYSPAAGDTIKAGPGRVWSVVSSGTDGTTITLNDGADGPSVQLTLTAGQSVPFPGGWPFATSIVVSAVTGTFALTFS